MVNLLRLQTDWIPTGWYTKIKKLLLSKQMAKVLDAG